MLISFHRFCHNPVDFRVIGWIYVCFCSRGVGEATFHLSLSEAPDRPSFDHVVFSCENCILYFLDNNKNCSLYFLITMKLLPFGLVDLGLL